RDELRGHRAARSRRDAHAEDAGRRGDDVAPRRPRAHDRMVPDAVSAHATAHAAAADMGSDAEPARAPWQGVFALKVDVDTRLGLRDGAPRLLELLAHHGVQATFFVAMGPDRTGLSIRRVLRQKGFLAKMVRSRAPSLYPLETMLRGTLL